MHMLFMGHLRIAPCQLPEHIAPWFPAHHMAPSTCRSQDTITLGFASLKTSMHMHMIRTVHAVGGASPMGASTSDAGHTQPTACATSLLVAPSKRAIIWAAGNHYKYRSLTLTVCCCKALQVQTTDTVTDKQTNGAPTHLASLPLAAPHAALAASETCPQAPTTREPAYPSSRSGTHTWKGGTLLAFR